MENVKGYRGTEKRTHPRFHITIPAFLRLSVMKEGNPTILELDGETVDISLEGVKLLISGEAEIVSSIEDAKEGRGVDVGVEIVTEKKRVKAVGDVRWFKTEESEQVAVGIHLKGMGREDRGIWEDFVKSITLGL
ncbi:MAG: PilZ domain-containing protein [Syntrophobacterales bacterium]|nr:MAG: PilZ domain-containing protein [Syntrophobacterales bacterium]